LAHWSVGTVYLFRRQHVAGAEALEKSASLNPGSISAQAQYGCALAMLGRYDEALARFDKADSLGSNDPVAWLSPMGRSLALFFTERYEEAAEWARRTVAIPIAPIHARGFHLAALSKLGRTAEADALLADIRRSAPNFTLSFVRRTSPFSAAQIEIIAEALAAAGLPED
jgi:tetratricopeptide (TPR) repeat protein